MSEHADFLSNSEAAARFTVEPVQNGFVVTVSPDAGRSPYNCGTRHVAKSTVELDRLLAMLAREQIDRIVAQYKPAETPPEKG